MKLKIQVDERKYRQLNQFKEDAIDAVCFKLMEGLDADILYVLVHGDECIKGNVVVGGYSITTTQLLDMYISTNILDELGCTHIETISCYGGYQSKTSIGKYTIDSCHEHKGTISINTLATRDDKYWLILGVGEDASI